MLIGLLFFVVIMGKLCVVVCSNNEGIVDKWLLIECFLSIKI